MTSLDAEIAAKRVEQIAALRADPQVSTVKVDPADPLVLLVSWEPIPHTKIVTRFRLDLALPTPAVLNQP